MVITDLKNFAAQYHQRIPEWQWANLMDCMACKLGLGKIEITVGA